MGKGSENAEMNRLKVKGGSRRVGNVGLEGELRFGNVAIGEFHRGWASRDRWGPGRAFLCSGISGRRSCAKMSTVIYVVRRNFGYCEMKWNFFQHFMTQWHPVGPLWRKNLISMNWKRKWMYPERWILTRQDNSFWFGSKRVQNTKLLYFGTLIFLTNWLYFNHFEGYYDQKR